MAKVLTVISQVVIALVFLVLGLFTASLTILFTFLRHPFTAFKKVTRKVPPGCLLDRSLGCHEYVTANGIKFHHVTAGDRSKPLMLFIHGFPEFWFSWRYQLTEFSKDYHVVAIDLRGYGETDRPPNRSDYIMDLLTKDIVELIPALGYSKCILVSHDWGGAVSWSVAINNPELIDKFIVMDSPHPKVFQQYNAPCFKQVLMSWYMYMLQWPVLPELMLSMVDYKALKDCFKGPAGLLKNRDSFTDEIMEAYVYTFSQPGALTAALNYYRCMFKNLKNMKRSSKLLEMPILVIWGDKDTALSNEMADMHSTVGTNVTVKHVPDSGHWVQQDAPEEVNQFMRDFLKE